MKKFLARTIGSEVAKRGGRVKTHVKKILQVGIPYRLYIPKNRLTLTLINYQKYSGDFERALYVPEISDDIVKQDLAKWPNPLDEIQE